MSSPRTNYARLVELLYQITYVLCAILFIAFTFVVAFGAPFLPTLKPKVDEALKLIDLKPGQTLLELGSGDGRVLKLAAKQGIRGIGYELNPLLVIYSKISLWRYRRLVKVKWANFWKAKWPPVDGIFVFLLQPYMEKLDKKVIKEYSKGSVKLASFAFTIDSRKPAKSKEGLYLYKF